MNINQMLCSTLVGKNFGTLPQHREVCDLKFLDQTISAR